ncbi:hypothetical protein OQA88_1018 [Cercophora sp. LCS_1]
MPSPWLVGLLAAALPTAVLAVPDDVVSQDGFIRFPIVPRGDVAANHTKRQLDVGSKVHQTTYYTINLKLGNFAQSVPFLIDTFSSETWANPTCSKSADPSFCQSQPRFTSSGSLVDYGVQGSVTYAEGYVNFEYVGDYVGVGCKQRSQIRPVAATITSQIFGAAYDSGSRVFGTLGLAPDLLGWSSPYPFLLDSLAQQSLINSRAFSLDLRGYDSAQGSVVFGGIDTGKFEGELVKIPIIPAAQSPDGWTRFWVYLAGLSVTQADGTVVNVYTVPAGGKGQPVAIDSSRQLSAFPTQIFNKLVAAFPSAQYVPSADLYLVDCLDVGEGGSIDFVFATKTIKVPYYEFVWRYPNTNLCVLGAVEDSFAVLGDSFLRSAYVVFDWDNRNLHFAQAADCGTNLVAIGKGADAVPSVGAACAPVVASSTVVSSASASASAASSVVSSAPASISASVSSAASSAASSVASSVSVASSQASSASSAVASSAVSSAISSIASVSSAASSASAVSSQVSSIVSAVSSQASSASSAPPSSAVSSVASSAISSASPSSITASASLASSAQASASAASSIVSEDDYCDPDDDISSTISSAISSASSYVSASASASASSIVSSASSAVSSAAPASSDVSTSASSVSAAVSSSVSISISASASASASSAWSVDPTSTRTVITFTHTTTSTITSCAPHKTACHAGAVVTEIITAHLTVCPATTGTYAIPQTFICSAAGHGCASAGATRTALFPITVVPVDLARATPRVVPGCSEDPFASTFTARHPVGPRPTAAGPSRGGIPVLTGLPGLAKPTGGSEGGKPAWDGDVPLKPSGGKPAWDGEPPAKPTGWSGAETTLATAVAPGGGPYYTAAPGNPGNGTAGIKPPVVVAGAGILGTSGIAVVFGVVVLGLMNL